MRNQFASQILDCAIADPNVLLLTGDHGYALFSEFMDTCPDQFINCGVAEQNMVCVAAGLAKAGFMPMVYALSAFIPARALEHIKLSIVHPRRKVIFFGDGAGFVYGQLGTSHHGLEDIALLRVLPGIRIFSPATPEQMKWSIDQAIAHDGPSYIRIGRADQSTEVVSEAAADSGFRQVFWGSFEAGRRVAFIATGSMVDEAVRLADTCCYGADVFNIAQIKPVPIGLLQIRWQDYDAVVTFEEHMEAGGMGSMVAQEIAAIAPVRVKIIGARDFYPEACGDYVHLKKVFGLTGQPLIDRLDGFLGGGLDEGNS